MSTLRKFNFTFFVITIFCIFLFYAFRKYAIIDTVLMFFVIFLCMNIGGHLWAMERN